MSVCLLSVKASCRQNLQAASVLTVSATSLEAEADGCTVICSLVDEIVWVKMTVNRRLAKSHGYYLQHAKEVCLVGKKGKDPPGMKASF